MEHLPAYMKIVFILTTVFTFSMLYKATKIVKSILIIAFWLIAQAGISLTGYYIVTEGLPPRFMMLLLPPVICIGILFFSKSGKAAIKTFDAKTLTLTHIVRVPVELTLYWLFLYKAVPELMTFEGRNFDILCGLTAPVIYYFGYIKKALHRNVLILWNIVCLVLLVNIVITAVLSAPFQFQQFGFGQPDIALFYFPFIWLPCFIVPVALFAHLTALKQLFNKNNVDIVR